MGVCRNRMEFQFWIGLVLNLSIFCNCVPDIYLTFFSPPQFWYSNPINLMNQSSKNVYLFFVNVLLRMLRLSGSMPFVAKKRHLRPPTFYLNLNLLWQFASFKQGSRKQLKIEWASTDNCPPCPPCSTAPVKYYCLSKLTPGKQALIW